MTNEKKLGLFSIFALVSMLGKYGTGIYILHQLVSGYGFEEPFVGYYVLLLMLVFACFKLQAALEAIALSFVPVETPKEDE